MTHGITSTEIILPASSNAKIGRPLRPVANKSTAPVAKINTGNCIGKAIKGTRTAPFFNDNVKLLATADSMSSIGLPVTIDAINIHASNQLS